MTGNPIWILLDATNYVHRDLHAAGADRAGRNMRSRLEAMQEQFRPERMVACFDAGESFRRLIEPTYKGNRKPSPEGLQRALDDTKDACLAESVDVAELDTFEADDLIATFARLARLDERRVVIGSSDKDLHQLLEPDWITQLLAVKRLKAGLQCTWMTTDDMVARYGVWPDQWVDYRCMIGDPSDNIAGVDKIGPKAAAKILQTAGSLDRFFADPFQADVTTTIRTRVFNARQQVEHLRRLIALDRHAPLPETWSMA